MDEQNVGQRDIDKELSSKNLAKGMDEEKLHEIGSECREGFLTDERSRSDWERCVDEWEKLAMQVAEEKSFPWPKASNVKYPMLSTAAMQFAARAYPSLVPSNGKLVQSVVIGKDETGEKKKKAERVASYMSYQILHEMDDWEEDMDKLLMMLPIIGTVFKKTYWHAGKEQICSCLVHPKNLIVNYWATSLEDAERISEIIYLSPRLVKERQRQGVFLDVDLPQQVVPENGPSVVDKGNNDQKIDDTVPYTLIEQHTFLDLKDDGFTKPYIVTFIKETGQVLRITARFREEDVKTDEDGKIVSINPRHYYTKFSFVPNPDGSFYSLGFGTLLGPLNAAVNSLINQLVDAGTLNNMQSGFIGKGLRLRTGDTRFTPGEWKNVNATGDDLKKQIVPLPAKEPSNVLFELMGSLVTSGKELASVAEIFTGKMPGQNTPATTTMATVEQGMKVFTAVYKRIFRSLGLEFKKIYELNGMYVDPHQYVAVLDETIGPNDFDNSEYDICPGADPTAVSQSERLMKAQGLLELLPTGVLDPVKTIMRVLDAQEQPNWQELLNPQVAQTGQLPPSPPDPKMMEMQMKMQMEQQKAGVKLQETQQKMELERRSAQEKMQMEAQQHAQDMQIEAEKAQIQSAAEIHKQRIFMAQEQASGQQKLQQNEQSHQQKMTQQKEVQKSQSQTKSSSNGSKKK